MHLFKQVVLELSNNSDSQVNASPSARGPDLLCLCCLSLLVPCHLPGLHSSPVTVTAAPETLRSISIVDKPTVSLQLLPLLQWSSFGWSFKR